MWTDRYFCKPGVLSHRVSEGQRKGAKEAFIGHPEDRPAESGPPQALPSHLVPTRFPPPEPGSHLSPAHDALTFTLSPAFQDWSPPPPPRPQGLSPARPRPQALSPPLHRLMLYFFRAGRIKDSPLPAGFFRLCPPPTPFRPSPGHPCFSAHDEGLNPGNTTYS